MTARYENLTQIYYDISRAGGNKAATRYTKGTEARACALFRDWRGDFWINNLPTSGYSHTAILEESLNINVFLFRYLLIDYARATFWPKDKEVIYVDLNTMDEQVCKILKWEDCGYHSEFTVRFEGDTKESKLRASGYKEQWVFLDIES